MRGGMLTPIEVENYRGNRRCCSSMLHDTGKGGIHLYNVIKGIPSPSILIGSLATNGYVESGRMRHFECLAVTLGRSLGKTEYCLQVITVIESVQRNGLQTGRQPYLLQTDAIVERPVAYGLYAVGKVNRLQSPAFFEGIVGDGLQVGEPIQLIEKSNRCSCEIVANIGHCRGLVQGNLVVTIAIIMNETEQGGDIVKEL